MTAPLYNLTDTWNNGATVFTAILMNVTDTGHANGSSLIDLQIGGTSKFTVDVTAAGLVGINIAGRRIAAGQFSNEIAFTPAANNYVQGCVYMDGNNQWIQLRSDGSIVWSADTFNTSSSTVDLRLYRDAAGILAQRNGVNAQASRLFETFTDAANNSMLRFDAGKTTTGVHRIMSEANGTGTKRPIAIDAYSKSGAPTSTELPAGTAGVFKDSGGGGVVIAYNDGGTIKTAALT